MKVPSHARLRILQELLDAFNAHDLERIMEFFIEDCVLEMPKGPDPWGSRFVGRKAVKDGLASRFAGIPDVHYDDATHLIAGDVGVSRWVLTGTGIDGNSVKVHGCDFYTFQGEKIAKKDSYWKITDMRVLPPIQSLNSAD